MKPGYEVTSESKGRADLQAPSLMLRPHQSTCVHWSRLSFCCVHLALSRVQLFVLKNILLQTLGECGPRVRETTP